MLLFEQFNQFHALWFDEFFSLVENKIVKIKRKKWSKLSFFISKLLRMPLPGSWKTGNGSANHSYSYGHDCTCGWQNPFPVFELPGKDTFLINKRTTKESSKLTLCKEQSFFNNCTCRPDVSHMSHEPCRSWILGAANIYGCTVLQGAKIKL